MNVTVLVQHTCSFDEKDEEAVGCGNLGVFKVMQRCLKHTYSK
jgi:hypothetical protein